MMINGILNQAEQILHLGDPDNIPYEKLGAWELVSAKVGKGMGWASSAEYNCD